MQKCDDQLSNKSVTKLHRWFSTPLIWSQFHLIAQCALMAQFRSKHMEMFLKGITFWLIKLDTPIYMEQILSLSVHLERLSPISITLILYYCKCSFVSLLPHHSYALVKPPPSHLWEFASYENLNEKLLIFLLFSKICG